MRLIAGNSNKALSEAMSSYLNLPLTQANLKRFSDKEIFVEILDNVRGYDTFFVQSTSYPTNDNLMELLIAIDALKRGSARRITAVIPYFGYARQDRKVGGRTPISAKLVANLITAAGADRVLTMELHAGQIQGFFDIPVDNLIAAPVFVPEIKEKFEGEELCIVSPDVGGVVRARALAKRLGSELAIIDKRREKANQATVMNVIGEVKGKICIMVDDIVDTGGTLCHAAVALEEQGAKEVHAYTVHGVLSGPAVERVTTSPLKSLVITDTITPSEDVKNAHNIEILSVAHLVGEAIRRTHEERSISALFKT